MQAITKELHDLRAVQKEHQHDLSIKSSIEIDLQLPGHGSSPSYSSHSATGSSDETQCIDPSFEHHSIDSWLQINELEETVTHTLEDVSLAPGPMMELLKE